VVWERGHVNLLLMHIKIYRGRIRLKASESSLPRGLEKTMRYEEMLVDGTPADRTGTEATDQLRPATAAGDC